LERVLIANRGEIAIRIMKACQDLGLDYVMIYTKEDQNSLHVKLAEQNQKDRKRLFRVSSYRDPNDLFEVADITSSTAIHPGYGFIAEDYRVARRAVTRERPIKFIGPRWQVLKDFGNKINTKKIASALGIPSIPGSEGPIYNEMEAEDIAVRLFEMQQEQGIPNPSILIKPSTGGGGMGIEEVVHIDQFRRIYRQVRNYSKRQFGDEGVLIEQYIKNVNHIEVQLVCSQHKEIVHCGTRNCTIQTGRRQKRIEVAPGLDFSQAYKFDPQRILETIISYSIRMARYVDYDSLGTWEWLVTKEGTPYLLEVNPRIQVENAVSSRITTFKNRASSINLIREQIRLALGDKLGYKQNDLSFKGVSIEFRIVAEDTKRGFIPWSGCISNFQLPTYSWLDVYTHVPNTEPYVIPSEYDPNLALAVVWGETFKEAKERGLKFLSEAIIEGENGYGDPVTTNIEFLKNNIDNLCRYNYSGCH